ncbi:helix-turn-helix domain-containing protein [Streptosporangium sp. 'caverna']|uniref:helix-turn-helix domain-containing protein n=1 Tax=Streptosporangium sp. 'caverna' TaxID=2202249 RepID=UPI000D7E3399|nr:helix-turn-helix transcriptional regulator [Streptosporangium sp. 'caverna']AWS45925.1 transcriptional regulator [Streptosporangium sp. 'caverna']
MHTRNHLGEFLYARRTRTTLEQVELTCDGRRRTSGLRREEVAMLSGVSPGYYARLEQGRERQPSIQVLAALARVFQLDAVATEHLYDLVSPRRRPREGRFGDQVPAKVVRLIERWDRAVAFVVNERQDILAKNRVATALLDGLTYNDNVMRLLFLDPTAEELCREWDKEAQLNVAHFRAAVGNDRDEPFIGELINELSAESMEFRRIWARHDVGEPRQTPIRLRHSGVGDLTLWHETLHFESVPGLSIFVAEPEPGSLSEGALASLVRTGQAG